MSWTVAIAGLTALLGFAFALALLDQYRARRHTFQLVWAAGMLFYGVAAGCEALAGAAGWNELLYRTYYLTGAVWTVAWLGLGTAFLLGRTRFGYGFAFSLLLAGLFTFLTEQRYHYPEAGAAPTIYLLTAIGLAFAISVATYFQSSRWPALAGVAVVGATVLSLILMATVTLPAPGYQLDAATGQPVFDPLPGSLRLLTPYMNVTGAFSLLLGAIFSTYVFMPKKRVLDYSLDAGQAGDQFLFNLFISPVAIAVNFVASIPGALRALLDGTINSRVPATILIAIGAFIPTVTDSASRFGVTGGRELGHFLGLVLIFAGFLVSIDVFNEVRIPFTRVILRPARREATEGAATAARGTPGGSATG